MAVLRERERERVFYGELSGSSHRERESVYYGEVSGSSH